MNIITTVCFHKCYIDIIVKVLILTGIHSKLFIITPANAPLVHTVLHRSYMFWCDLRHPQTALHQDLKLTKI
jgi:hypothetical protein